MTPSEPPPVELRKQPINLLRGWPSPHVLPAEALKAAANKVLSDPDIFVPGLQYGPDPGYQPLREELSKFLSKEYGTKADAERICISGGASQAMACILQSYTEPVYTKAVWAIAPCYYLACAIFEDSGFEGRLRAVPEDDEGINLERLESGLKGFEDKMDPDETPVYKNPALRKVYRHVIYAVPSAANPSGKTMTLRRREALVRLARKYNCLIVCDDVYDFLQWPVVEPSTTVPSESPLPRVKILPRLSDIDFALGPSTHDTSRSDGKWFGHAISNGSFSKIVGPGIRTGWVEGTRDFAFGLAQTGSTKSGGAPSQLSATIVCEMMKSGQLARHIDGACRPSLQRRHALMMKAVHEHLDQFGIEVLDSNPTEGAQRAYGGYFVWITFPQGPAAQSIAKRALEDENLVVPPGEMFQVKGDEKSAEFANSIRLCFAWEEEQDLVEGVARLGRAVASLTSKGESGSQDGSGGGKLDAFF
ncbi:hypothetical protein diail_11471 [Diaporthe ilicicola]|nr:hypothetical protein diail_11471 [Diaporthe ilicicola]